MNVPSALRRELSSAPGEARREAWVGGAAVVLVSVVAGWDLLDGTDPGEALRWVVALVGSVGLALHTVAEVLHRTGRSRGREDGSAPAARFRSPLLRRTYLVLPRLALLGAVLLALAAGAEAVIGTREVRFWLAGAIFGFYAYRAGRTVLGSARELYGEALSQRDRADRARSEASHARLLALQARMNPHFLFNALNTVASLSRTDPRAAERTVEALASVLRQTLRRSERVSGTVREEVAYVRAYLEVEQERWGERLDVEWRMEDDALSDFFPPMTLQPLVENALEHGLGARLEGGTLRVSVRRDGGTLVATVADDGPGWAPDAREGTGLGNLRERLETLYGEAASVEVDSDREGTEVRLRLPAGPPPHLEPGRPETAEAEIPCAS